MDFVVKKEPLGIYGVLMLMSSSPEPKSPSIPESPESQDTGSLVCMTPTLKEASSDWSSPVAGSPPSGRAPLLTAGPAPVAQTVNTDDDLSEASSEEWFRCVRHNSGGLSEL